MFSNVYKRFFSVFLISVVSISSLANERIAALKQNFPQCIERWQKQANGVGVSKATQENIIANLTPIEKLLQYDSNQPEFVQTFTGYFGKRVNQWRIDKGREKMAQHKALLAKLNKEYGIPGHYLVAFWGLETNFGAYKGKVPTIRALATLGCDARRSEYFSAELMQALLLLEREGLTQEQMIGSWAGAMGHTQFMPTAYMKYAKDGDGDGKVDLWNNEQDALTSAAHFLQNLGWQAGFRWGREVLLPQGFDYQLAGKSQAKPLSFWHQQGVQKVDGNPVGKADIKAALLIPAGHSGSAFLVYNNFDVILRWNNSEYYGIAVGHLADRIAGLGGLSKPLPDLPKYTLDEMKAFQDKLNQLGFDVGVADGILGPATRKGVRSFQQSVGLIADGYPSKETVEAAKNTQANTNTTG